MSGKYCVQWTKRHSNERVVYYNEGESLGSGYPAPRRVRSALFKFPNETSWQGLQIYVELEVMGLGTKSTGRVPKSLTVMAPIR